MPMPYVNHLRDKLRQGRVCLGTGITFTDPTVTEVLCGELDFVWIDMEHNALSLEAVQGHILAAKGSETTPLVRVTWNDPALIKPVLDIGAAGVIVPLIRSADEARRAVAACKYPPEGIRGFGPRRASNFGRLGGPEFCRAANAAVLPIVQVEHIDAVNDIDNILAVPGLASIVFGPNDLAASMGHTGEPSHPEVVRAMEAVLDRARRANVFVGIGLGDNPDQLLHWANRGAHWLLMGTDYTLLLRATTGVVGRVREHLNRQTA